VLKGFSLGRIWKVPIQLHSSWFVIIALITWALATGYFPAAYPQLNNPAYWLLGGLTAVLFAASVLLHELGHVAVALREKIPVKGVTLFMFGGMAQLEREPQTPGGEFRIAIAGPLVSFSLAGVFGLLWALDQTIPFLAAPSEYLMRINLILAIFNLVPGFPLDGGRVLRAFVWQITRSRFKATRIASLTGQLFALGFVGFGILTAVTGNIFNGLWMAMVGWLLKNAAATVYQQAGLEQSLSGVTVSQVMDSQLAEINGLTSIQQLVNERILPERQQQFLVRDGDEVNGLVMLENIVSIPQRQWPYLTVRQVMASIDRLDGVDPTTELLTAIQKMETENRSVLPVLQNRHLVGILRKDQIIRFLNLGLEMGMRNGLQS